MYPRGHHPGLFYSAISGYSASKFNNTIMMNVVTVLNDENRIKDEILKDGVHIRAYNSTVSYGNKTATVSMLINYNTEDMVGWYVHQVHIDISDIYRKGCPDYCRSDNMGSYFKDFTVITFYWKINACCYP